MQDTFVLRVFEVDRGACAIMVGADGKRIAMVDAGRHEAGGWRAGRYIRHELNRSRLDYLFITHAAASHDMSGLREHEVDVQTLIRNRSTSAPSSRGREQGVERRVSTIDPRFTSLPELHFDRGMGGVTYTAFHHSWRDFSDAGNLSTAVFFKYAGFKILFPGNLERAGWKRMLDMPGFARELAQTDVLVASHHGRDAGFCPEIFSYFQPQAVIVSDGPLRHLKPELVPDYRAVVSPAGVHVASQARRRRVLSTRRDGDVILHVSQDGHFEIRTSRRAA